MKIQISGILLLYMLCDVVDYYNIDLVILPMLSKKKYDYDVLTISKAKIKTGS